MRLQLGQLKTLGRFLATSMRFLDVRSSWLRFGPSAMLAPMQLLSRSGLDVGPTPTDQTVDQLAPSPHNSLRSDRD